MKTGRVRDAGERGEGIVSALMLLAGALLPLCYLVLLLGRVEEARLAAAEAASAAVRAAALAPSAQAAQTAAGAELTAAQTQTGAALALQLGGSFSRGGQLEAAVSARLALAHVPFLGGVATITLQASARAPVDPYRSFPAGT